MRPVPRATYRLQLGPGFDFDAATRIVSYLKKLGISHVYASPIFQARRGSVHGYDITDHRRISDELGGEAGFTAWSRALRDAGLGLILDFVPNHMGVGHADNPKWLDVLAWGKRSRFAELFDIDWRPAKDALRGKVLLPFLGDQYGAVLDRGELEVRYHEDEGSFSVHYYEHRFPLAPPTYPQLLEAAHSRELHGLLLELEGLGRTDAEMVFSGRLFEHVAELHTRLRDLARHDRAVRQQIDRCVARLRESDVAARRALHDLLEAQHYRLAYFRVAADEINYRRFFNINELAGIRVEVPDVFDIIHEKTMSLIESGVVQGLRIDHIDGLFDPRAYCVRLRDTAREDIYLVAEKILAEHEHLREDWQIDGTTGYDFLAEVTGLWIDPKSERALRAIYQRQTGESLDFDQALYRAKCETIENQLSAELQVLANMLDRIGERNTYTRDFTLATLRRALRDIVASFPVYRTYITPEQGPSDDDRRDIAWAVAQARKRAPAVDASVFDFAERALLTELPDSPMSHYDPFEVKRFALKLQQYTGPVMAKAVEDKVFYRHPFLLCVADVGADPRRPGVTVSAFHRRQKERQRHHPASMLATSTHDTKRGEDARARIAVLTEMPEAWARRVARWNRYVRSHRTTVDGRRVPLGRDAYLLYQALIGSWPVDAVGKPPAPEVLDPFSERVSAYAIKALREAGDMTDWDRPHAAYEEAVDSFVRKLLAADRPNKFLDDFVPFQAEVARLGMLNSLSQLVLRMTVPGVPDLYQGAELWDLSLVDPDNRRPVDFAARAALLDRIHLFRPSTAWLDQWQDGRIKLYLLHRLMALRAEYPEVFAAGDYEPYDVAGTHADHIVAFRRVHPRASVTVVVGRLYAKLSQHRWPIAGAWSDTHLDADVAGEDWLTGDRVRAHAVRDLLTQLPVSVILHH